MGLSLLGFIPGFVGKLIKFANLIRISHKYYKSKTDNTENIDNTNYQNNVNYPPNTTNNEYQNNINYPNNNNYPQ